MGSHVDKKQDEWAVLNVVMKERRGQLHSSILGKASGIVMVAQLSTQCLSKEAKRHMYNGKRSSWGFVLYCTKHESC